MQGLAEQQKEFGAAILDPRLPVPAGLVGPDGEPSPKRFAVYRNNVVVGLIEALRDAYSAVEKIVGAEFFKAMAAAFVVAAPPRSPIMLDYGAGFPEFIVGFAPAASLPYLADVARIERAWMESYHAAEAVRLNPAELSSLAPDMFGEIIFTAHPSLRVVRSRHPALTIWQMNTESGALGTVDLDAAGEDVLILRPEAEVEVREMPKGGATFLLALASGRTVVEALRLAAREAEAFDLPGNLAGLFEAGAITNWRLAETILVNEPRKEP